MSDDIKLCKDCAHFSDGTTPKCSAFPSLCRVTGRQIFPNANPYLLRSFNSVLCGRDGMAWKPKDPS